MDMTAVTSIPDSTDNAAAKARQLQRQNLSGDGLSKKQLLQAKKVSQDFEALVVGMMLKSMRETVGMDKLTGGGHGEEIYRSMLDQEYAAVSVKRGGGMGLAKMIEKDIIRQESRKAVPKVDHHE
ncbi:MAG: flagellar biosynthesis protein FlgJ [Geobacteraceae bacterium GWC2_55_20]|nr:rod-binding protein [Deltaproteobacteria bacterium]OGU08571.1 MAG: flagellar biosynthesis protein FlgJ [Geobacteraceae bacterium GWC2_55_20]OGU18962.1 MAG: flagellar biosynthesis protein FlgJ [Geobacteraceae bacterium GWF2_54_21]HBA70994.1 flagellar biosynthesis protein FlgJ [Geobacter sp.]HCE69568.1 flagellar biosynthesis protein FlgJ [Geobacter sp.]